MGRSRNRPSSGRNSRRGGGVTAMQILGAFMLTAVCAAVVGGYLWLNFGRDREVALNAMNCPVTGAVSMTAVIIDATDPISDITMDNLNNEFRRLVSRVGKGGYLRITSLTGIPRELPMLFDGCNPGDGSTVDQWTNNPSRRQRRWEETFGSPLEQIPRRLETGSSAAQSPIMAAIQKMRLDLFDSDIATADAQKRIIVVSDMIEHTDLYSQYRAGADFEAYIASEGNRTYRTDLDGIELVVLYIERQARKFPSADHVNFWKKWVVENRGVKLELLRLEGLN